MSSYRVARTIDGAADIELNFSNLMRLDGDISHSPPPPSSNSLSSISRRYEERMDDQEEGEDGEKELETGETGKCSANANENGGEEEEEEEVLVDSWCTAVPMETLGDTRISIFPSPPPPPAILANPICPRRYSFILHLTFLLFSLPLTFKGGLARE